MLTNDLKKGDFVRLRNSWIARLEDNMRGATRICTVWGFEKEIGSVYAHDMVSHIRVSMVEGIPVEESEIARIEHTAKQEKVRQHTKLYFG